MVSASEILDIGQDRIVVWSLAQSLCKGARKYCEMTGRHALGMHFSPKLLDAEKVSLCSKHNLVFKDYNLFKAVNTGFALPQISSCWKFPVLSVKLLYILTEMRKLYFLENLSLEHLSLLFEVNMKAYSIYATHHISAKGIFNEVHGLICFKIANSYVLGWLLRKCNGVWEYGLGEPLEEPSVVIVFKDIELARKGILGKLDHMLDPVFGGVSIFGRIPLADRFGYVARMIYQDLPSPNK